ncbi:MAG: YHS domain-containing protein [Anaerolineales bacterium]|nr:YHS domain-containing protein [Anaerolineales bacterium]
MKDPVCDMRINPGSATAQSTYKGVTYYFCSLLCKQLFDRDPEQYVQLPDARHNEE